MSVIAWEAPPPAKYGAPRKHALRSVWRRTVEDLKLKPGEWALVCKDEPPSYARESCARMLRQYGCQVRTRTTIKPTVTTKRRVSVWARWPNACSANMGTQLNGPGVAQTTPDPATPDHPGGNMRERTVRDLAWLAGFLEGEACFHLSLRTNQDARPKIVIRLAMTDEDVVYRAWRIAGVGKEPRPRRASAPGGKAVTHWDVSAQDEVASLMMTLYPLMGARRQQKFRECLLVWRQTVVLRGRGVTHCPKGHAKRGDNLYVDREGKKHCKICRKASLAAYRERQRATL